MHFKQPEILYFLFLLIVPILVHLFQLRRFKTSYFTNVRFLKELVIYIANLLVPILFQLNLEQEKIFFKYFTSQKQIYICHQKELKK